MGPGKARSKYNEVASIKENTFPYQNTLYTHAWSDLSFSEANFFLPGD